jgi:branched-chain amino acid transport system substrate-binding protein
MNTVTKRIALSLTIAGTAVFLPSCKEQDSGTNKTLKVGAILSLSGGAATYGQDADRGAKLAVKHLNGKGSPIRVEYIPRDDKSNKTEAEKLATALMVSDKVNVLLGPAISPSALGVSKLATERKIPMMATSATQDDINNGPGYSRDYAWRICFSDNQQAGMLAKFSIDSLKLKDAVIIYDEAISYSVGLAKSFEAKYQESGGRIVSKEKYSVKDTDYSSLIDRIAKLDAKLLFIAGWDENIGPMFRQAGRKWDKFKILGADGLPTPALLELSGGNTLDTYAVSHFARTEAPNEMIKTFVESYRSEYGTDPSPFAALGYDAMLTLHAAAERATDLSGPALNEAIRKTEGLALITTPSLKWDANRNPVKPLFIVKVSPEGYQVYEQVDP